jgi:hypothetical protein
MPAGISRIDDAWAMRISAAATVASGYRFKYRRGRLIHWQVIGMAIILGQGDRDPLSRHQPESREPPPQRDRSGPRSITGRVLAFRYSKARALEPCSPFPRVTVRTAQRRNSNATGAICR